MKVGVVKELAVAVCKKVVTGLTEHGKLYNIHVPTGLYDPDSDEEESSPVQFFVNNEDDDDEKEEEAALRMTNRFFTFEKSKKNCTTLRSASMQTLKPFVRFFVVLALLGDLSVSGRTMSLRDVYYAEKQHFNTQEQCNDTILTVGVVLGLRRHEMGIVPAARGLACGLLRFRFRSPSSSPSSSNTAMLVEGEDTVMEQDNSGMTDYEEEGNAAAAAGGGGRDWLTLCTDKEGKGEALISGLWTSTPVELIDVQVGIIDSTTGEELWYDPSAYTDPYLSSLPLPRFLLIVEKEGIFRRLQEDRFCLAHVPSIIVTGCGFPDVATRHFVTKLYSLCPTLTPLGLCDYNPYGLALLLTYSPLKDQQRSASATGATVARRGRGRSRFETAELGVPLQWLGFRSCHVTELRDRLHASAFQPLTERDYTQLARLAQTNRVLHSEQYLEEVEAMQKGGVKCELQAFYGLGIQNFSNWLQHAIAREEWV